MTNRQIGTKWAALALTAALLLAPSAGRAACGDYNGSGPDAGDVTILMGCVVNPNAAGCSTHCASGACDINGDGSISIADAVVLLNHVAGLRTILPLCTSQGPQIACGSTIPSGSIATNQVWGDGTKTCEYFLDGLVLVEPGTVITIRPGTTVSGRKFSSDGSPSALIFKQGDCADGPGAQDPFTARINAAGTPSSPIVFTSDQSPGSRAAGDWAGLAFNGCAAINAATGLSAAEGLSGVSFGGGLTPDENDYSGVARYVRVEFAGRELAPDNELNVVTMNALGADTDFSYIQAHVGLDDAFEWFGGAINMNHIAATVCADDCFDWQLGTTGAVQFGLIAQKLTGRITSGTNGFEGDNNENGFTLTPYSNPLFCNVTIISDDNGSTPGSPVALFLRRGTSAQIGNTAVVNFYRGLQLRDPQTAQHAATGPTGSCTLPGTLAPLMNLDGIIFASNLGGNFSNNSSTGTECNSTEYGNLLVAAGNLTTGVDPGISSTWPPADPRPTNGSLVADPNIVADCDAFGFDFENAPYVGAFQPGGTNWLETPGGWISWATN
jgi:hypothetical protein